MAYWNGIPLHKAILVRHEDYGALSSAVPQGVSDALDYIGREGIYADKSDIEREATRADEELLELQNRNDGAERALDYIGREGAFSSKGADRQVDATYWGQNGPVSRSDAARAMSEAGAYMQSIVSVDRRYAAQLGLTSKEDFEKLIRNTWTEQAALWTKRQCPTEKMFHHKEDINWVASYHTDADKSLHVHIYTWGRPGDMDVGDRVSRESTRQSRQVIYQQGYAQVRGERNQYHTYLRDIARLNIEKQLGVDVDQGKIDKQHAKAEANGWEERVPDKPDWDPAQNPKIEQLREKLTKELEEGHGRLADNWVAGGTANDLIRELEKASPATKQIAESLRATDKIKADLAGYTSENYLDRDNLLRHERMEYLRRLEPSIKRAHMPHGSADRSREHAHGASEFKVSDKIAAPPRLHPKETKRTFDAEAARRSVASMPSNSNTAYDGQKRPRGGGQPSYAKAVSDAAVQNGMSANKTKELGREFYSIAREMKAQHIQQDYYHAPQELVSKTDALADKYSEAKGFEPSQRWRETLYGRIQDCSRDMPEPREPTQEEREQLRDSYRSIVDDVREQGSGVAFAGAAPEIRQKVVEYAKASSEAHGYSYSESWAEKVYDRAREESLNSKSAGLDASKHYNERAQTRAMVSFGGLGRAAAAIDPNATTVGGRNASPKVKRRIKRGYEEERERGIER